MSDYKFQRKDSVNSCASVCKKGNIDEGCIVQMHNTTTSERCIADTQRLLESHLLTVCYCGK